MFGLLERTKKPKRTTRQHEHCEEFWSVLTAKERKMLKKAKTEDKLLKAIFKLDSPDKIKEALMLTVTDCYH